MPIRWTKKAEGHIARHGVTAEEVERMRQGRCRFRKHRGAIEAIGTSQGRYLVVVFRPDRARGVCTVVTARDASIAEKRIYRRRFRR